MAASTQSMKTPLRANVSAKLSSDNHTVNLITREILSCTSKTHVISGPRGVGKTWTAHIVAQLPLCKNHFSDGVIWIGLGTKDEMNYTLLRKIYQRICKQVNLSIEPFLDKVVYNETYSPNLSDNEKKREENAMNQARNIMVKFLAQKNVLLVVDGLYDSDDIKYFEFTDIEAGARDNTFRLVVTTTDFPEDENLRIWQLTHYHNDEAKKFFFRCLEPITTEDTTFIHKYSEIYKICHGNLLSIKTLSRLVDDKIESKKYLSLDSFVSKFGNVPSEPKIQIFNILEALFTNSSLGESFNKILWRCFAAFSAVFKRDNCQRPCIGRSPVRALFSAIITRVGKGPHDKANVDDSVDKVIDFLVQTKVLTEIDGFDEGKIPRIFYQMGCDIYQEFGEQLSSSPQTNMKLHQLFVSEYTNMFSDNHAAFGSNEIDHFMLRWLPYHLRKSGDIEDQALTLPDYRFIQERVNFMGMVDAVKKHIDDAENFVRMSTNGSDILLPSYEAVTRVLEANIDNKENSKPDGGKVQGIVEGLWCLAISLFSHFYVKEGCQLVQKANEYDDDEAPNTRVDMGLFNKLADSKQKEEHVQTVRSLIKIGAAIARSNRRQHAANIILLGLKGLMHCLGEENIEVARAHVFIGEVFYTDLKLYDDAMSQFRSSLPILLKELGEESAEVFDAIILCGKCYVHLGFLDTALEILEKIAPQLQGPTEIDVRMKVASIYMKKGNSKNAQSILLSLRQMTTDEESQRRISLMLKDSLSIQRYTI